MRQVQHRRHRSATCTALVKVDCVILQRNHGVVLIGLSVACGSKLSKRVSIVANAVKRFQIVVCHRVVAYSDVASICLQLYASIPVVADDIVTDGVAFAGNVHDAVVAIVFNGVVVHIEIFAAACGHINAALYVVVHVTVFHKSSPLHVLRTQTSQIAACCHIIHVTSRRVLYARAAAVRCARAGPQRCVSSLSFSRRGRPVPPALCARHGCHVKICRFLCANAVLCLP